MTSVRIEKAENHSLGIVGSRSSLSKKVAEISFRVERFPLYVRLECARHFDIDCFWKDGEVGNFRRSAPPENRRAGACFRRVD